MKRSEFVALVNSVIDEERKETNKRFEETIQQDGASVETLLRLLLDAHTQAAEIAGIVTGRIIEKLGVVPFEDD